MTDTDFHFLKTSQQSYKMLYDYCPNFPNMEIMVQRGGITCPRSHSQSVMGKPFHSITHNHLTPAQVFFFFLTSLLEYNCFTMLCQLLLYNKVNQLYVYIYPHISSLLHHPPPSLSHPFRWTQSMELISLCYVAASHQLPILYLVVYICPCHSLTSSQPTLPPPHVLKAILCVCVFIPSTSVLVSLSSHPQHGASTRQLSTCLTISFVIYPGAAKYCEIKYFVYFWLILIPR